VLDEAKLNEWKEEEKLDPVYIQAIKDSDLQPIRKPPPRPEPEFTTIYGGGIGSGAPIIVMIAISLLIVFLIVIALNNACS
jgi:hypothetical protein